MVSAAVPAACQRARATESLHSELHARSHSARASSDVVGVRAVKLAAAAAAELQRSKLAARRGGSASTACRERYDCTWTSEQLIGLELPSREDDNFNPGTRHGATGGSPPPLLASSTQLFDYRPLSLTCIYVSVRAARLWCSMRTPAAAWVCACATQGSERCFARCRLDAVLRQLRSLAHERLPEAVRLLPGRGISAGRLASSRPARSRHARCSVACDIQMEGV